MQHGTPHAVDATGGGRSSAINSKTPNRNRGDGNFRHLEGDIRVWLMIFAPILIGYSLRLVMDQSLMDSGNVGVRSKLPKSCVSP